MTTSTQQIRVSGSQGIEVEVSMFVSDCPNCGVLFGITTDFEKGHRKSGAGFYCPNGHSLSWNSEAEKKRKELEQRLAREEADRSYYQERLRREREQHKATKHSLAATKGVVTRQRRRAQAALCPVDGCGRSFVQLRRHLDSQHPGFTPTTSATTAAAEHATKETPV